MVDTRVSVLSEIAYLLLLSEHFFGSTPDFPKIKMANFKSRLKTLALRDNFFIVNEIWSHSQSWKKTILSYFSKLSLGISTFYSLANQKY